MSTEKHCCNHSHEHHSHGDECCHEHHHHHEEDCCHEHHHHHEEDCCHEHHHDHDHDCCHEEHHTAHAHKSTAGMVTKVYTLEGLDCANCAAKIERKLNELEDVGQCTITFATRQLRLTAKEPDRLIPMLQRTIDTIEDGVTLKAPQAHHGEEAEEKSPLIGILVGAALFALWEALNLANVPLWAQLLALIPAYLILGGEVLLRAAKNMGKGQIFDENFLMSIATLGAFAIGEYPEAVGVMLFYRIGEYFEDRAVEKSRKQIMSAVDLRPENVTLIEGEQTHLIPAGDAKIGDIVLVRPGDRIPLDGVILEGESRIDTSAVTGEPVPVKVGTGSQVLSGCVNTSGTLKLRVEKPLEDSMVTRILNSVENAAASKPAIDKFITRFARVYTPAVVISALVVALVLPLILPNWHFFVDAQEYAGMDSVLFGASGTPSVFTALTFLVISCPCALVLSVPLAFFSGIGAASKKGILFKGGSSIEALAQVKAVVMDKTGTLTQGNFRVQQVIPAHAGVDEAQLLTMAAGCEQFSTHPIGVSILAAAREHSIEVSKPTHLTELAGQGIQAELEGHRILCGNQKLIEENTVDLTHFQGSEYGTQVLLAKDGILIGQIVIADTLKTDAVSAVGQLKRQGLYTVMLTGDAEDSARFVAEETGIDQVCSRLLPEQKLTQLQAVRTQRGSVMFVGDGINDAPVLAGADVGAAMGSGADAAIEAADVVFMNSDMSSIPQSIAIARRTRRISWQNVWFALAVKLLVMALSLFGFANMWLAVFADTGVSMLCLLNSIRILYHK